MRTKNFFLMAALIISGLVCVNSVKAEGTPSNSDQVTVNLKFKPVQSISVNTAQKEVNFVYESAEDYLNGVSSVSQDKHLDVFSTGLFQVSVQASAANFTPGNENITIPVSDVSIMVKPSEDNNIDYTSIADTPTPLSDSEQVIIQSKGGGTKLEFDVEYDNTRASGINNYINGYDKNSLDGEGATVFTTTVVYSIVTI